jgi:hypothetical protein
MAKAITKTTVKMTSSNTRVALVIKYVNGEILKVSSSMSAGRMSCERPNGMPPVVLKTLFAVVGEESKTESPMAQFERFAKVFETTTSIQDAIDNVAKFKE